MIKKIVTIATIFAAFVLSGCSTANVPLSASEKAAIKSGELVKFTTEDSNTSQKITHGKIYVCFVSTEKATDNTPCHPKLSAYMGNYLKGLGVNVAQSKELANEVVYASMTYFYVGSMPGGDSYRSLFDETMEESLDHGNQPQLSPETMDAIYKKDTALHQNIADQSHLETAGKVLVGLAAMAIGGVNGGLQASQALTGITNPQSIEAPNGTKGPKEMIISLYEMEKGKRRRIVGFIGIYDGPRDIFQAFGDLFPSAVKSTAELFVQNTTVKN